ncbi:MAG: glycine cleavage system protein H [Desulfovibrio sp.]|jgi:uncharacterized protein YbaR (Trm112 family)|nr:glycine cleavage system protein H [Desulfovibrio sp.]
MAVNTDELLKILACPICLGDLALLEGNGGMGFACEGCRLVYPVRDDIPVMLKEEAVSRNVWDNGAVPAPKA